MGFQVQILGISSATPTINRSPSGQVVIGHNESYLIDCGENTQVQFLKHGTKMMRIKTIFISHLHPDHFSGLLTMLTTMAMNGRTEPMTIYSPIGLELIITSQLYYSGGKLPYPLHFRNIIKKSKELIFENNDFSVEAIGLEHGINCWGFIFKEKFKLMKIDKSKIPDSIDTEKACPLWVNGNDYIDEKGVIYPFKDFTYYPKLNSYAYITDTRYFEMLSIELQDIQVIYHESTYLEKDGDKASDRFHSTAKQAGKIAKSIGAEKLILGHFSARYDDLSPFKVEAETVAEGVEVIVAEQGKIYQI